jgi:hypothetical protein
MKKAVQVNLVAAGLKVTQTGAKPVVAKQRSGAVEVRHDEESRPSPELVANLDGRLQLAHTCGRDVVDRNVDRHTRS